MREIIKQKNLPYTPDDLFNLVGDIESYPQFLPWCRGARIMTSGSDCCQAELLVGNSLIQQSYRSQVHFNRPHTINVTLVDGPLDAMENRWRFSPLHSHGDADHDTAVQGCQIDFYLAFQLKSSLLSSMMNRLFEHAFTRMMSAFEQRRTNYIARPHANNEEISPGLLAFWHVFC